MTWGMVAVLILVLSACNNNKKVELSYSEGIMIGWFLRLLVLAGFLFIVYIFVMLYLAFGT